MIAWLNFIAFLDTKDKEKEKESVAVRCISFIYILKSALEAITDSARHASIDALPGADPLIRYLPFICTTQITYLPLTLRYHSFYVALAT